MRFDSFNFHPEVLSGVEVQGYEIPTPIQEQAIPPVMEGRDVIGLAQTGTGKTAAFVLPILHRLFKKKRGRVLTLILAPTRELAEQIDGSIKALGGRTGIHSVAIYGGVNINPQIAELRRGVEIVVACPGRLLDLISRKAIDLSRVEVLVLDEADRMFDMGFLPDIRRIMHHLPKGRQTLLFSATMPDDIKRLANDFLVEPVTVQVDFTMPLEAVSHALYPVPKHLKTSLLLKILKNTDTESVIVFTRTKHRAKRLGQQLVKLGHRATSLQGNMSQNQRQASLDGFRDGRYQILVATDIAARGIDVSSISHVVNYDIPDTADAYTHRIGRTGRAEKSGDAFTLVSPEDEDMVRTIERRLGSRIERRRIEGFDYDVAPVQRTSGGRPAQQRGRTDAGSGGRKRRPSRNGGSKTRPSRH